MRYMNHKPLKDEDQPGSPEYGVSDETQPEVVNDLNRSNLGPVYFRVVAVRADD